MTQILPCLYLGGLRDASNVDQLREKQIDYLLSIHELNVRVGRTLKDSNTLRIQIADIPEANISEYFSEAIRFIHNARLLKKSVLVHCVAGVSRSVCIVAAYLIAACDMSYTAALAHIVSKRPCANPNFGFRMQLVKYAEKIQRCSLEGTVLRDQFEGEEFDELKTNDKKFLLEFIATPLSDAPEKSVVCGNTDSPSSNIFLKAGSEDSVKYQSNLTMWSVLNDHNIRFIDQ